MATLASRLSDLAGAIRDKINTLPRIYEETIGDGATTVFTITHNRNKRGVIVQLYETSGEYAERIPDIKRPTVNTITVGFEVAPDVDQYTVVVLG